MVLFSGAGRRPHSLLLRAYLTAKCVAFIITPGRATGGRARAEFSTARRVGLCRSVQTSDR
jgi:hypothetical protein